MEASMPGKFVRLTSVISSSRSPVAVNARLVMAVKPKGANGSEIFFDAERAMHVEEPMDEVVRRLEEALQ
jgi:hypothetical protein